MFVPIITLVVLILVFRFFLIYRFAISSRWWERVDYLWYGLGFFGILLAAEQFSSEEKRLRFYSSEQTIARYTTQMDDLARQFFNKNCGSHNGPQCALAQDIHGAYSETFRSANWLDGSVHYQGKVFPSWNYFIKERAKDDDVTMLEGELSHIASLSTAVLDISDNVRPSPMATYDRFKYNFYFIWPYVLALGIALKVTKVSAKIRALTP